jgi:hypothetical protein
MVTSLCALMFFVLPFYALLKRIDAAEKLAE